MANLYTLLPAVNNDYEFPPEIQTALSQSEILQSVIDSRSDAKAQQRVDTGLSVRQYQSYRWTNQAARDATTGMRAFDRGYQIDTGIEYIFVNGVWQIYGSDPSILVPFMQPRQYQNYRWVNDAARAAQTGMRIYDRGIQLNSGNEYQYNGNAWELYVPRNIPVTDPTTDASNLKSGTLSNARLDYGVVSAFRNDRSVDAPTNGAGINGDWNIILQPGVYRIYSGNTNQNAPDGAYMFGTLLVIGAGGGIESRTQMYFAHTGGAWYRTAWNGNDWGAWRYIAAGADLDALANRVYDKTAIDNAFGARDNRLNGLEASGGPGFTVAGGWTVNRANSWRAGRVAQIELSLKRTGGAIGSGNIANIKMGDVPSGMGCATYAPLSSGPGGIVSSFYISGTAIYLAATTASIANQSEVTCGGTWIMS